MNTAERVYLTRLAHIFPGAGIFQPYRGTTKLMYGSGMDSEPGAMLHWAHWADQDEISQKLCNNLSYAIPSQSTLNVLLNSHENVLSQHPLNIDPGILASAIRPILPRARQLLVQIEVTL